MVVFRSEPQKSFNPLKLFIGIGVVLIAMLGIFFLARHQQSNQPPQGAGPVYIPGMVRPGEPDFEYYKNRIRIERVTASLGINFSGSRIAIISGFIYNDGDRKLEAVELHIALYDVYGQLSKERIATPLRPGVGLNRPLEPLEERSFTVWIEPIEQFWNPKQVNIEITGLKYR